MTQQPAVWLDKEVLTRHTRHGTPHELGLIIIIIIIHEFQSDASPEELQGRCSVTVFSLAMSSRKLVTFTSVVCEHKLSRE